jgi:hypothetical protein
MTTLSRSTPLGFALLAALACSEPTSITPRPRDTIVAQASFSSLASQQISAAVAGRNERGEQEEMLRIESQLPGFGGFYLDSVGEVVAYVKPSAGHLAATVRSLLHFTYTTRKDATVRQLMLPASRARIAPADYSLSELIGMEQLVSRNGNSLPGFTGVGTHIRLNRVKVYFQDTTSMTTGIARMRALGVPDSALSPDVMERVTLSGTFQGYHRPTRGGIKIQMGPLYGTPDSAYVLTHGYNVSVGTPFAPADYFMTVSHGPNVRYHMNGHSGAPVFQPDGAFAQYGTITLNPPWTTGAECNGQTYCTRADVALGTRQSGQTYERKVGTSTTGGINGGWGSLDINGWYAVANSVSPDLIWASSSNMHKSGMLTGTTSGDLGVPCADIPAPMGGVTPGATLLLQCASIIEHAGWGLGDSGAPVFGRVIPGQGYHSVGIEVGGSGAVYTSGSHQGKCSAGFNCKVIFQRWSNIEARFSLPLWTAF